MGGCGAGFQFARTRAPTAREAWLEKTILPLRSSSEASREFPQPASARLPWKKCPRITRILANAERRIRCCGTGIVPRKLQHFPEGATRGGGGGGGVRMAAGTP